MHARRSLQLGQHAQRLAWVVWMPQLCHPQQRWLQQLLRAGCWEQQSQATPCYRRAGVHSQLRGWQLPLHLLR
jgi:hypothetical protein